MARRLLVVSVQVVLEDGEDETAFVGFIRETLEEGTTNAGLEVDVISCDHIDED